MDIEAACNLCGHTDFMAVGNRPTAKCRKCGSLERTRLMWMYIEEEVVLGPGTRVLHLAPERGTYSRLRQVVGAASYTAADLFPNLFPFAEGIVEIDLCNLNDWPSERYDLIVHSHVLEHTPCSIAYTLYHLHRMLTPTGRHICVIPFSRGRYDETFGDILEEERVRRFGQNDHVRLIGADDRDMHIGKIIRLPPDFDATTRFAEERLLAANIPAVAWRGFTPNTVLSLAKDDYRLA